MALTSAPGSITAAEFRSLVFAHYGRRGLSEFARAHGLNRRTASRYASGDLPVPPEVAAALGTPDSRLDMDEWIVGQGTRGIGNDYVVHLARPRFVARILEYDSRAAADLPPASMYAVKGGYVLSDLRWIDRPPLGGACDELLDRAGLEVFAAMEPVEL